MTHHGVYNYKDSGVRITVSSRINCKVCHTSYMWSVAGVLISLLGQARTW